MQVITAMVVADSPSGPTIERRDIDAPVRGAGQVLIDVRAASVNRADLAVRAGTHVTGPTTGPTVVGLDCAGVVLEADAESGLAPGDRVMTMVGGGLAERVVVDARLPIRLPDAWSFETGAAAVTGLMTGHNALRTAGRLAPANRSWSTRRAPASGRRPSRSRANWAPGGCSPACGRCATRRC